MIPGKHNAKVITCTFGHSSQKKTPQFEIVFDVNDETITGYVYLTEKAMGIARKSLKAMGFDPDTTELQALVENANLLMGRECEIVVVEEQGQDGEWRPKVSFINPLPGPVDSDELKKLTKGLREVKGSKKPAPASTTKAAKPGDTTVKQIEKHFTEPATKGDDIPF